LALIPDGLRPKVIHQAGDKHLADLQKRYTDAGVKADIRPFIDDMPAAYAQADLVICRSGAMTVSEIAACGVASCLIPFPYAIDDHQTANAKFL
jgi:UDP-N-acetylglucosamine--N-acetylmuramyl-(pentapeptide) pyrophosphoryl-undecaprenol N-acetylglucosamine transferase